MGVQVPYGLNKKKYIKFYIFLLLVSITLIVSF